MDALPALKKVAVDKVEAYTTELAVNYDPAKGYNEGAQSKLPLSVLKIGELGIATAPIEMDHRNGIYVKENSPFAMTMVSAYTNGSFGYIPAEEAFPNGGYEVESCRYVKGTAEQIEEKLVSLLIDLHQ